jgi:hypothetical protein
MNEFFIAIIFAVAVFGVLVAGLALRQRRHPDQASGGCAHHSGRIRCLDCPSRAGAAAPGPDSR